MYKHIEIVVARYNEDLSWTKEYPFNQFKYTIYNKGTNDTFTKPSIYRVFQLPNVGRCDHTYLYHIVNNYYNLADVTIFLPGSTDSPNKYDRSVSMVNKIEETNETVLSCNIDKNIHNSQYNFELESYSCTNSDNLSINLNSDSVISSDIRPFGKWFETVFTNNEENNCIAWNSIIGISKQNIIQKPISFYEKLLKQVDSQDHLETVHFMERSWYAVFYPYNNNASFI